MEEVSFDLLGKAGSLEWGVVVSDQPELGNGYGQNLIVQETISSSEEMESLFVMATNSKKAQPVCQQPEGITLDAAVSHPSVNL